MKKKDKHMQRETGMRDEKKNLKLGPAEEFGPLTDLTRGILWEAQGSSGVYVQLRYCGENSPVQQGETKYETSLGRLVHNKGAERSE